MKRELFSGLLVISLLISMLGLAFNIHPAKASGTIYIRADGSIDPSTAPIYTADNITYTLTTDITSDGTGIVIERNNIIIDGAGHSVQGTGFGTGIELALRRGVTAKNIRIANFYYGIRLADSAFDTLLDNIITNIPIYGIALDSSNNNVLSGNLLTNDSIGICLVNSSSNTLSGNTAANNIWYGLYLHNSTSNRLSGNIVSNNGHIFTVDNMTGFSGGGITIEGSRSNILLDNIVSNNTGGIDLVSDCGNSVLSGNVASENIEFGIRLWMAPNSTVSNNTVSFNKAPRGIGLMLIQSTDCRFFHNSFIGNVEQARGSDSANCVWDNGYPSGGNYWSDYTGVDQKSGPNQDLLGGDGIGDSPYEPHIIDHTGYGHIDRYPLMNPWLPTPAPKFTIGDRVTTTANLNVREGPGLSYIVMGTVPEGAHGQIMAGPVEADGYVWWDVDYNNGARGWSAENWLEIHSDLTDCGMPVLYSALTISRVDDTLTADFKIQNQGTASIRLDKLLVGGRFNWGTLTSGDFPDFPPVSVTLAQNEIYEYKGTLELTEVGNYQFFVAYYIENPSEQEKKLLDQNNWNTCVHLAEGLTDNDRSISLDKWPQIVISSPLTITPSGPYHAGNRLIARFGIKNKGSVPTSLPVVTVGGRDPDGLPVDFDWTSRTVEPGDENEYIYIGTIILPEKEGNYHFFCAYRTSWGSWNPSIDLDVGLTDDDRTKDLYVLGTKYDFPLGGIVIPEADFPEGEGKAIPIYIPTVVDDSNVIREEDGWQTVKTLAKAECSFDWGAFADGLLAAGSAHWDPTLGQYVLEPTSDALDLMGSYLLAYSGAQSVAKICITIQKDSQGSYRAILQVSDPEAKSLYRTYALQGSVSIIPGQDLPVDEESELSDAIAEYFKLPAVEYPNVYLPELLIDEAHKDEEYNAYVSLSKDNRIELTPKIYKDDAYWYNLWTYHWYNFLIPSCQEVVNLKGQAFVDFEKCRATVAESKLIQKALAPIVLVPESAIVLSGGSPCEFRIYDSQGRVTGLVNGETHEEIPHSMYLSDTKTIIVYGPSEDLHYEVVGTGAGTYELRVTCVRDWNITTFIATDIPIARQTIHQYTVDWTALSRGEEGVTAQVDSNGDGLFEHTFTSDSELTQSEYVIATDTIPPQTRLDIDNPKFLTAGGTCLTSDTPIVLSAEDDLGGSGVASTAYRIHNATYSSDWIAETETFYLIGLSDGTYQIDYNSTDIAGNVELTNTAIIVLDNTPPSTTISIGQPKRVADKTYVNRDTPFALGADDAAGSGIYSIAYRISNTTYNSGWLPYTAPFRLTALSDGVYTISFNATDKVGNMKAAKSIQVTLFSWNFVFTDSYGRGTILKINAQYKLFWFSAPGKDFGVKKDPKMFAVSDVILIGYKDSEMQLAAAGAYGRLTFCAATAWDRQTGKKYLLIQKPIFRCHPLENLIP